MEFPKEYKEKKRDGKEKNEISIEIGTLLKMHLFTWQVTSPGPAALSFQGIDLLYRIPAREDSRRPCPLDNLYRSDTAVVDRCSLLWLFFQPLLTNEHST